MGAEQGMSTTFCQAEAPAEVRAFAISICVLGLRLVV